MSLEGAHDVTAICADAPRNVDFYGRVLGLRLVKKTVNFDAPERSAPLLEALGFEHREAAGAWVAAGAERHGLVRYDPPPAGFDVDEPLDTLGAALKLPPQYEDRRAQLEQALTPLGRPR
jgi:catechol 2,3-dioxygenase-like lactoylglutathione lyase family enzyme